MNPETRQYIETEILPFAGEVETETPALTSLDVFIDWLEANQFVEMPITCENLMSYLMLDNENIIVKKRNFYLSYADFDKLPLELQGTEHNSNFHKMLIAVIVLPCDFVEDGNFWFLTDDEFEILKAVRNG